MQSTDNRSAVPPASEASGVLGADQLFREYSGYVAAFLRRLGIAEASVDDAVQEVFLVAHTRGGYQPGPASARTWLGAITVRVAANGRRAARRNREMADGEMLVERHSPSTPPDIAAEQRQELAQIERALKEMNTGHREVFLFAVEGHSCGEIALSVGVPTGTVYSRVHATRSSLSVSRDLAA